MYQKKITGGREDSSKFKASLADRATQREPVSKRWEKGREERKNGVGRRRNGKGGEMKEKESEKPDH